MKWKEKENQTNSLKLGTVDTFVLQRWVDRIAPNFVFFVWGFTTESILFCFVFFFRMKWCHWTFRKWTTCFVCFERPFFSGWQSPRGDKLHGSTWTNGCNEASDSFISLHRAWWKCSAWEPGEETSLPLGAESEFHFARFRSVPPFRPTDLDFVFVLRRLELLISFPIFFSLALSLFHRELLFRLFRPTVRGFFSRKKKDERVYGFHDDRNELNWENV